MICAAVERCAGIDVGKMFLAVCVMIGPLNGEARVERRRFGTITSQLEALRDWLKQETITAAHIECLIIRGKDNAVRRLDIRDLA